MPPGRPAPLHSILVALLATAGASLAIITLAPQASTRMYAQPWNLCYWAVIAAPILGLCLRAATRIEVRLPSNGWTVLSTFSAAAVMTSAFLSPFRGAAVLWSMLPLSGLALFHLTHDWLSRHAANCERFDRGFAIAGTGLFVSSIFWWSRDVLSLIEQGRFAADFFSMRNPHPLGHSNYTAGLALLFLPWMLYRAETTRGRSRALAGSGVVLGLAALFTSGSRGGLLGFAVMAGIAILLRKLPRRRFIALCIGALAILAVLIAANPRVRATFQGPDPAATPNASNIQRSAMLHAGLVAGRDRPVLGWGLHTTPLWYPRYRAQLAGGAENVLQLHSLPFEIWAGLGVAGLLALGGFAGFAARDARKHRAAAAALAGYGVFALTDHQLDVPVFVFGIAMIAARIARPGASAPRAGVRWGLAAAPVAITGLLIAFGKPDRSPALNAEALAIGAAATGREKAVELLQDSLAVNGDQEIAHFNLGWLLLVPDPLAAAQHFQKAAQLVPDKGGVYFGLGLARLNQGDAGTAARLLALECLNDPRFIASPWWKEAGISDLAIPTRAEFGRITQRLGEQLPAGSWLARQAAMLHQLAPRLGEVPPGAERNYRRQRIGYTVLMRNHDIAPPVDLYDVRESAAFETTLENPLPPKGWLPSEMLLKLLDEALGARQ